VLQAGCEKTIGDLEEDRRVQITSGLMLTNSGQTAEKGLGPEEGTVKTRRFWRSVAMEKGEPRKKKKLTIKSEREEKKKMRSRTAGLSTTPPGGEKVKK